MDSSTVRPRAGGTARLPADARIGRVRLRVADLARALAFYRDILGLELGQEETNTVTLSARSGDSPRALMVLEERPGISRRPRRPTTTGLYHVALLVPSRQELGRALIGLSEAGYPLRGVADHGVSESLYLDDPDGNGLEIYADRPRALWPLQEGVVQLTVDPMDVDGVTAAGRESAAGWRGLPAETVVGHVHLTVSRMERAVGFYRDVIGFDVMMRIPSLTAVSAGGYHHHLNLNTWAGEGAPADSEQVAGLATWELTVPGDHDRRALIDRLAAAGALIETSNGVLAADPDRIPIEIAGVA
jgi:catechol 2,3-dioxygenase